MRPPRWRCGEPGCPAHRRPREVSAMGEYDHVDVALAELEGHYGRAHPELVDDAVGPASRAAQGGAVAA